MNSAVSKRVIGLALLMILAFLLTSLLSYAPSDLPESVVFPHKIEIYNLCGIAGAHISSLLFNAFGLAAFILLLPLFGSSVLLLCGKDLKCRFLRGFGIFLMLIGISGIFAFTMQSSPGPIIGPGGYLGAVIRHYMGQYIASVGSCIFLSGMTISGMILAFDYTLYRILMWLSGAQPLGEVIVRFFKRAESKKPKQEEEPVQPDYSCEYVFDDDPNESIGFSTNSSGTFSNSGRFTPPPVRPFKKTEQEPEANPQQFERFDPSKIKITTNRFERSDEKESPPEPPQVKPDFVLPSIEQLIPSEPINEEEMMKLVNHQAELLEKTFADFGFNIKVTEIQTGPVISQFEIQLERGLRLNKITNLCDDLAIVLKVPSVRIVAPIPGKNTVAIEVPSPIRQLVRIREIIEFTRKEADSMMIPLYIGKDVSGAPMIADLAKLPHLLIAGRTGTGKSVCLNSLIVSVLMTRSPEEVRMVLIDPKMVELTPYKTIPHLIHPVVTDMKKAEAILGWAVEKMEERYQFLARAGVRHLSDYNKLSENALYNRIKPKTDEEWDAVPKKIPFLVIVADEMADLMMTSAKEVETHIIRLAQKSRAVGIHLVLATQKPTVDIITGLIKSNLPARIAFEVASRMDSQVVLDRNGAEKLLGNGDMLFLKPGTSQTIRGQGTFVTDDEIEEIIKVIGTEEQDFAEELMNLDSVEEEDIDFQSSDDSAIPKERDELFDAAVEFLIQEGRGSVSLLQRRFSIGYGRAARLIDAMAEAGVVGPYNGSQARDVIMTLYEWRKRSNSDSAHDPDQWSFVG